MKDLCVPIPNFGDHDRADIVLTFGGNKIKLNYRVVSFPWDDLGGLIKEEDEISVSLARITRLKKNIESYDSNWELIQIYTPPKNALYIQVLYRKKQTK